MMESVREAYFKYLESILIEHRQDIEPTVSEIEYRTTRDVNGKIVIYSPLLGEKYRLWNYYSNVSENSKYGYVIAWKAHSYDFENDCFMVNIKTGKRHKINPYYFYKFYDKDRIIADPNSNYSFLLDFEGHLIGSPPEEKNVEDFPKLPRKESIKGVEQDGFFKTIYKYDGLVLGMKPILDYDGNIICYKDGEMYLYDRFHDSTTKLCSVDDFDYTFNSIIVEGKRYMLYKGKMIDVTDYPDIDKFMLSPELINVYDFAEFKLLYETSPDYQAELDKARLEGQKLADVMEEERRKKELVKAAEEQEKRKSELKQGIEQTQQEMFTLYQRYLDQIEEYESLGDDNPFAHKKMVPITEDILFIKVDGHKEINPFFLDNHLLRYADLSLIDFAGVKLDHVECLAYTNANIDPQTVFNKDLSFSDLRGIYHTRDNFDGVNMEGTIVDEDKLDFTTNLSTDTIINDKSTDSSMNLEEATSSLTNDIDR